MPIENIPAIREDYPLFSWSDHAESFAALKQGGEVARFKKETWNAIIETLEAVISESGLQWDTLSYTTAENAKITQAYGELKAVMFNAVRHNIDRPAPIGWRWKNDENFRGYIGRNDFKGYSDGVQGDLFYSEYLLEIVRKLNLLIEILRGTAPFDEMEISCTIETPYEGGLVALPSAPMEADENAQTKHNGELIALRAAALLAQCAIFSKHQADINQIPALPMNPKSEIIQTKHHAALNQNTALVMPKAEALTSIKSSATLFFGKVQDFGGGSAISETLNRAEADIVPSFQIGAESRSNSLESAELNQGQAVKMNATESAKSSHIATADIVPHFALTATGTAKTKQSATIEKVPTKRMGAEVVSESKTSATIDSAWLPPIRTGNNLHIRQVYNMERNGNNLRLI